MSRELELYKEFVDALAALSESVQATKVRAGEPLHTGLPSNELYNEFVGGLTERQRQLLAELLDDARSSGIHDVLVLLESDDYRLNRGQIELAKTPFGTQLHFDFVCRREGDPWPDGRGA